jgi:CRP-like cAMP-binding protein
LVNKSSSPRIDARAPQVDGSPLFNKLLLGLPSQESHAIFPQLEFERLRISDLLNETGQPIKYVYFMNSGLASILTVMADGKSVEVGLAGKEGFVGIPLLAGFSSSPTRVIVQIEGSAFRMRATLALDLLRTCPKLERRLLQYSQIVNLQATQVAACNRLHEVDERLARWLLMSQDRIGSQVVPLTQEFLAHMLGTRRSSVTVAAGTLQKAGLITYVRGSVNIVNRDGLEDAACECYCALVETASRWDKELSK